MAVLRSLLARLRGSSEPPQSPSEPPQSSSSSRPDIVRLANTQSEYEYVKHVKCRSCGGATSSYRLGSATAQEPSYEGGIYRRGVMHDGWTLTCIICKCKRELIFEVPGPSLEDSEAFIKKIQDGSIKVLTYPDADEARRRFAGEMLDLQSVRTDVIKELRENSYLESDLEAFANRPIFMLALADLNLTEFVTAYIELRFRLAEKNHDSGMRLTVELPESVVRALDQPHSTEARDKCLDFLLQ